ESLGKVFDCTLKDFAALQATGKELGCWLTAVDKPGLPGKFKAWMYQHGTLPRPLWPLLVYDVPVTTVEGFEKKVTQYLRRWLGLPRSLSNIALYGRKTKLQLPFNSLTEEFKVIRAREVLLYRDSIDKVAAAGIEVRTGRKWRAQEAVDQAEARLRHSVLVGTVAVGRAGIGNKPRPLYNQVQGKVQDEVRAGVEEALTSQMVGMRQQGAWMRWEQALDRKITWSELWKAQPHQIKFMVQSVYDVLPSPSNLFCWGLAETPACPLCQRRGSLEHILSCCPKALAEGCYRWRHDQVLRVIADVIGTGISFSRQQQPAKHSITFVKAGEKGERCPSQAGGSPGNSKRLAAEVPWEDRMEEAYERKRAKYEELASVCRSKGWRTWCDPIEVGCRVFAGVKLTSYIFLSEEGLAVFLSEEGAVVFLSEEGAVVFLSEEGAVVFLSEEGAVVFLSEEGAVVFLSEDGVGRCS
ncbi:hypothetical protein NFI96_026080, partial [Prochilodus magdalenae]